MNIILREYLGNCRQSDTGIWKRLMKMQVIENVKSRLLPVISGGALVLLPMLSHADSTAATGAISAAQTDALAVTAALVVMGVAVWGGMFLYNKFFK